MKAPNMKKEPCARVTTFIRPKMSERPAAVKNSRTPYTSPFRSWATNNSMNTSGSLAAPRFRVFSVDLLARVLHVLRRMEDFCRDVATAGYDLRDVDILDRIMRRRVHAERPARRIERNL